jgi:hypothetical protein
MDELVGLNWVRHLRCLSDDEIRELAAWLVAELLQVGEFMEIVDRAYARAPGEWRRLAPPFVARIGRPVAAAYARRKLRFGELVAALEDARASGALPGEVDPRELQSVPSPWMAWRRDAKDLLAAVKRARCRP